jgi:O-antigen/teichoic acid export membrane protein
MIAAVPPNVKASWQTEMTEQHPHAQGFVKKILSFSLATWVGAAIAFVVTPIITRIFLPDEFGRINLFITYLAVIESLALIGMSQGYLRFYYELPKGYSKNNLFKFCLLFALVITVLVCVGILLFGDLFSQLISGENGPVVPLCLCFSTMTYVFLTLSSAKFRVQRNARGFNIQEILGSIAVKASYLLAAFWGATYSAAIICITVSNILLTLVFLVAQRKALLERLPRVSRTELWPIIRYSLPTVPALMISFITSSVPLYFLSVYCDFNTVGIFAAALSLVVIVRLIRAGFSVFWPPYVFENHERNAAGIRKVHLIFSVGVVLFALLVLLFRDPLYLILGEDYRASASFFAFMLANPILYTISETTGLGINIAKKSELSIIVSVVALILCVLACWMLIPPFKTLGAALAMAISALGQYLIQTLLGERYYRVIESYVKSFLPPIVLIAAATVNLVFTDSLLMRLSLFALCIICLIIVYRKELGYLRTVLVEMAATITRKSG